MVDRNCRCINCDSESAKVFSTGHRGYGSKLDALDPIMIPLCEECQKIIKSEWFTECPIVMFNCIENYRYEKEIIIFIENLPKDKRALLKYHR